MLDQLSTACGRPKASRPCRYPLAVEVLVLLIKLRLNLPYRAIEAITGIDAVTAPPGNQDAGAV